jgi:DNA-binding IclR family transcriptional regulator
VSFALALKIDDVSGAISELADLAGFPLDVAYAATHRLRRRGYLREEWRQYSLSEEGQELVAIAGRGAPRGHPGIRRPVRSR